MSELATTRSGVGRIQHYLLISVSTMALLGNTILDKAVAGERSDPALWIEVGGQFEQLSDPQERWSPDFTTGANGGPLIDSFPNAQKPPKVGYDTNVGVSFYPGDSDWFISASAHFGRARRRVVDSRLDNNAPWIFGVNYPSSYNENVYTTESHRILDFNIGKDVGIGLLGMKSSVSLGVRFANLRSRSDVHISSNFELPLVYFRGSYIPGSAINRAEDLIAHEFKGVGPAIEWKGSLPVMGEVDGGQLGVDGGVTASVLFGRQTTSRNVDGYYWERYWRTIRPRGFVSPTQTVSYNHSRRRNVTVPNLGGFIAVSYRLPNVKLSLGYRADMYFNAMDGGVSSFKSEDRGFFGPYFNLSVGLGG